MKKKAIIGVIIVLCVCGLACLGYIITNNIVNNEEPKNEIVNENTNTDNSNENNSNTDTKNEYQNIVLNSRVGLRILEKFKISNIYSDMLYNEIDSNGLSNKAKLLFTYITIIADTDKYSGLLRVSEDYTGNYITKADFESVAKSLFGNDTSYSWKCSRREYI